MLFISIAKLSFYIQVHFFKFVFISFKSFFHAICFVIIRVSITNFLFSLFTGQWSKQKSHKEEVSTDVPFHVMLCQFFLIFMSFTFYDFPLVLFVNAGTFLSLSMLFYFLCLVRIACCVSSVLHTSLGLTSPTLATYFCDNVLWFLSC